MAQLRRDYEKFEQLDTEIIVVGPEKVLEPVNVSVPAPLLRSEPVPLITAAYVPAVD